MLLGVCGLGCFLVALSCLGWYLTCFGYFDPFYVWLGVGLAFVEFGCFCGGWRLDLFALLGGYDFWFV